MEFPQPASSARLVHRKRSRIWPWALGIVGFGVLALTLLWMRNLRDEEPIRDVVEGAPLEAGQLERGEYLARIGNCETCHSSPGAPAYAGGRPVQTPFGAVYASNITPDPDTGLGRWNADHFWRALHNGRSRDGRLLYPAFPYPHFTRLSREDSDALFAHLRSRTPARVVNKAHALRWPYSTQFALALWRALYFEPGGPAPDHARSAEWNRGDYIVNGLAHCGACHAPRNTWGASLDLRSPVGSMLPGSRWYAPSLSDATEAGVAHWSTPDIARLLREGRNTHAVVSGPMARVVQDGTQFLNDADLAAVATYLRWLGQSPERAIELRPHGDAPQPGMSAERPPASTGAPASGARLYERHCADCHGLQGQSRYEGMPSLAGNRAVLMPQTANLIQLLLAGGFGARTTTHTRPLGMPPFATVLSDQELADVLTHIRTAWGHRSAPVSAFDVARLRDAALR